MRAERPPHPGVRFVWLWLWMALGPLPVHAQPLEAGWCEYHSVPVVSPDTGEVHLSRQKIGDAECDEIGAAIGELSPHWRQRLPLRVRWVQRSNSAELCRQSYIELGERRPGELDLSACVFLRAPESCTIVSASALSHAQLANAVRACAP